MSKWIQSPDIGQNSDGDISDFRISGQSLSKVNCHNSRTSNDVDKKLGSVTKLTRETKQRQKNLTMSVMSANCDVVVIFPIYGQSGAIRKLDSGGIVCKTYISINSNLLSYKDWK